MLRSCYIGHWKLPDVGEVRGQYCWSAPTAVQPPEPHFLISRNWHWHDRTPWPPWGEMENTAQSWVNGRCDGIAPIALVISMIASSIVGLVGGGDLGLTIELDGSSIVGLVGGGDLGLTIELDGSSIVGLVGGGDLGDKLSMDAVSNFGQRSSGPARIVLQMAAISAKHP